MDGWMDGRSAMNVSSLKNVLKFSCITPWESCVTLSASKRAGQGGSLMDLHSSTTDRRRREKAISKNRSILFCVKAKISELLQPSPHHQGIKRLRTQLCSDSHTLLRCCRLLRYESITFYYATYHSYYMVLLLLHQSLYVRVCVHAIPPPFFSSLYPRCECLKKKQKRKSVSYSESVGSGGLLCVSLPACCFFSEGGW